MRHLPWALLLIAAGCGSSHTSRPDAGETGDGSTPVDARVAGDASSDAGSAGCTDYAPFCADFCGSDYAPESADCIDGRWVCPPGTVDSSDCPSGTCWGPPLPGEECDDGWKCRPDADDWDACPELLCATCDGFGDDREVDGCACWCDPDTAQVSCGRAATPGG